MTYALVTLNAIALAAVMVMSLGPSKSSTGSLEYHTAMRAQPAVLGQNPPPQSGENPQVSKSAQTLSF